jgi:hypothetical protein
MADTLYVNDDGIQDILNTWLGLSGAARYQLIQTGKVRLFRNNVTVSKATVFANLTEVTSGLVPGYAPITLSGASWGTTSVTSHLASSIAAAAFTFTCTGGGTSTLVYGGYITDSTNTYLLCCWNFASGPYTMFNNGDEIECTPTMTEQSLN